MEARTLGTLGTGCNADSVEWCNIDGYEDLLGCGTYELKERADQERQRVGLLHLYRASSGDSLLNIEEIQTIETSGILDMKWVSNDSSSVLLGTALASGVVDLYAVNRASSTHDSVQSLNPSLEKLNSCSVTDGLCLSIDSCNTESGVQLVVSNSPGTISVLQCVESEVKNLVSWKAHDFEPWVAAWDRWNQSMVFTGGDDCKLKLWDVRSLSRPQHTCKRHSMGVCSVTSHPLQPHVFASGSYDEVVCVWDARHMTQPLCEVGVGGGVWRLKWHPVDKSLLLAACMHNGCHVLCWETQSGLLSVVVGYHQHKSLLYGIDWGRMGGYQSVVASCSFYDRAFHLWCYEERADKEG